MPGQPKTFVRVDDAKVEVDDHAKQVRRQKIEAAKQSLIESEKKKAEHTTIHVQIGSTVMIDGHKWKIVHVNQGMKRLSISPVENFKAVVPVTDPVKKKA